MSSKAALRECEQQGCCSLRLDSRESQTRFQYTQLMRVSISKAALGAQFPICGPLRASMGLKGQWPSWSTNGSMALKGFY